MSATPLDAFHRRVLITALVVHAITAWFSSGYYAADEHYQVIAFAQHRLGELPANELPWEYGARMRSALLPGIAYCAIVGCRALLVAEPLHIAFLLRLTTALFALLVVRTFVRAVLPGIRSHLRRPFVLLSYFLWFLPYQHVRFSSETCAGLLLLLGLAQLLRSTERDRSWLMAGLCFCLCVQIKPAMLVACCGAMGWFLLNLLAKGRAFALLLGGGVAALALGVAVDNWFYGEPTHTLWNYLYKNSLSISKVQPLPVLDETYPLWYYIPWIVKYGIWPIGAMLVAALLWLTWRAPRSWLVWCIWPYLVLVSLIPHKELRFLFPLVDLAPLLLISAWQNIEGTSWLDHGVKRRVLLPLLGLLALVNTAGLITAGLTAAGSGRLRLVERMIAIHPSDPLTLGCAPNEPLIWEVRIPAFYLREDFEDVGTFDPCSTSSVLDARETPALLIGNFADEAVSGCIPESAGYRALARSEASWATPLLDLYNSERHGPYALYDLDPAPSRPSEP